MKRAVRLQNSMVSLESTILFLDDLQVWIRSTSLFFHRFFAPRNASNVLGVCLLSIEIARHNFDQIFTTSQQTSVRFLFFKLNYTVKLMKPSLNQSRQTLFWFSLTSNAAILAAILATIIILLLKLKKSAILTICLVNKMNVPVPLVK